MDGQNGIAAVILSRKHGRKGTLLQVGFNQPGFSFQLGAQAVIFHFSQFTRILNTLFQSMPIFQQVPGDSRCFANFLSRLRLVPKIRRGYLFIEFG
jgi:hypothetical protein